MKEPELLTDLEYKIKDFLNNIEGELKEKPKDLFENFKLIGFKILLKRYLISLNVLKSIEERLQTDINNIENIDDLMTVYKSLVKGMDLLNSQLRFLMPSKLQNNEDKIEYEEINNIIDINEGKIDVKRLLLKQIKDTMCAIVRVRKNMDLYDSGSVDYWKSQNSYLELTTKLVDLVKMLDKIGEFEDKEEIDITMEEILNTYQELKELEEKEIKIVENKYSESNNKEKL